MNKAARQTHGGSGVTIIPANRRNPHSPRQNTRRPALTSGLTSCRTTGRSPAGAGLINLRQGVVLRQHALSGVEMQVRVLPPCLNNGRDVAYALNALTIRRRGILTFGIMRDNHVTRIKRAGYSNSGGVVLPSRPQISPPLLVNDHRARLYLSTDNARSRPVGNERGMR